MLLGVATSADPERERTNVKNLIEDIPVAPFDADAGSSYGPLRFATEILDNLIAAHATSLGVIVVTTNVRDFANYPGVIIENWLTPTT